MEIKVLGPGCPKCKKLNQLVDQVIVENNLNANVIKVEDIMEIMNSGVASTPALIVDGNVVLKGRVPSKDELIKLLTQ